MLKCQRLLCGLRVSNSSWHGTHVAGTIGAIGNNAMGVAGINWQSKLQALRVLGKCGGYTSDVADAIRWAAGLTVSGMPYKIHADRVVNLSLGGSGACDTDQPERDQRCRGRRHGGGRGRRQHNANASGFSPASCNGVIDVAATGKAGNRAYYSNYGAIVSTVSRRAQGRRRSADGDIMASSSRP